MAITYLCPGCQKPVTIAEDLLQQTVRCEGCATVFHLPGTSDLPMARAVDPSPTPPSRILVPAAPLNWRLGDASRETMLVTASLFWLLLLLLFRSLTTSSFTLVITGLFILANMVISVRELFHRRRVLAVLNLAQVGLFTVLSYQIYRALGAQHYRIEGKDLGGIDWFVYTFAHVIHATDVLDFLETYHINLQRIHHASLLTRLVLVALHLCVALFLAGLLLRFWNSIWGFLSRIDLDTLALFKVFDYAESLGTLFVGVILLSLGWIIFVSMSLEKKHWWEILLCLLPLVFWGLLALNRLFRKFSFWIDREMETLAGRKLLSNPVPVLFAGLLLFYIPFALFLGWRAVDWTFLWPLENALRTADICDTFEIFDWKIHEVPDGWTAGTLALGFRFLCGSLFAELLMLARLRWDRWMTIEDYASLLSHPAHTVRQQALERLKKEECKESSAAVLLELLHEENEEIAAVVRKMVPRLGPAAVPVLVQSLVKGSREQREVAAEALCNLGTHAAHGLPALLAALGDESEQSRRGVPTEVVKVLGRIGAAGLPGLVRAVAHRYPETSGLALATLDRLSLSNWENDPARGEVLAALHQLAQEPNDAVALAARNVLTRIQQRSQGRGGEEQHQPS